MKERKARVEDALHATRAAVEEGIVAGGGVASSVRRKRSTASSSKATKRSAWRIIRRAIEEPLPHPTPITRGQEGALIVQEVKKRKGNEGLQRRQGGIHRIS
jgi:chaperonin GroEL